MKTPADADDVISLPGASAALWWTHAPPLAGETLGCVGCFEADSAEAAAELLQRAKDRLRQAGCTLAVGPMDGNTWRKYRLVTWSDGRAPFHLEPQNSPEWPAWFAAAGFAPLAGYSSAVVDLTVDHAVDLSAARQRLAAHGIALRELNHAALEADLRAIHALSLVSFAHNFLYTPLDGDEFVAGYLPLAAKIDPRWVRLAHVDGELCGFVFTFPDPTQESHPLIVKTLAVRPERRCAGLGSVLLDDVQATARACGLREAIHALQHEKNTSLRVGGRFQPQVFRRYTLFAVRP